MRDKKFVLGLGLALATLTLMAIPMAAGVFDSLSLAPAPPLSYSLALGQR